jgi:Ni/Co efflux regulator RcnB
VEPAGGTGHSCGATTTEFAMNRIVIALLLASLAAPAMADNNGKGPKKGNGYGQTAGHCPPGLAKKNPPCVPPGQARAQYDVGDRITDDWIVVRDPWRYGIRDPGTYWRVGDVVFRVDPQTGLVLAVIGALAALSD